MFAFPQRSGMETATAAGKLILLDSTLSNHTYTLWTLIQFCTWEFA